MAELIAARDASRGADMVEVRLDGVSDVDVAGALQDRSLPAVVTCRPTWEGGRFDGSEDERRRVLSRALALGADYVDIEWRAAFDDLIRSHPARVVLSSHDFSGVPGDLWERVRAMRSTGARVIKIALTASRLSDMLPLLDIAKGGDAVVVAMGDTGVASRLLASRFGSRWTYGGNAIAPGQLPVVRMVDEFRFQCIGADVAIYGVVGTNVMHSLSPAMHNAAFSDACINAVYVPLRAADFGDFATFADAYDMRGASVTIPFKRDALETASVRDEIAQRVGAANTIRRVEGGWEATNTDVAGFLEPLEEAIGHDALHGLRASILGAGGGARAVIMALRMGGAHVTVHARRREAAEALAAQFKVGVGPWPPARGTWDVLVNCTPLGSATAADASPLPDGPFGGKLVYDLTYGPVESRLLKDARREGCMTLDGLPMLVAQAERQFEWWTGRRPAPGLMWGAARCGLGGGARGQNRGG